MHVSATLFNTLFCFADNADSAITWISCEATKGDFIPVQQRKSSVSGRIHVEDTATTSQFHEDNLSSDEENEELTSLFVCPEDGCVKKFLTHGRLDQHVMYGKHQFKLERLTLLDRAKISYAQHLEAGSQTVITVSAIPAQSTMDKEKGPQPLSKGWALKESEKKHRRFNKKKKQYMDKIKV